MTDVDKRLDGILSLINRYEDNEGFSLEVVKDALIDLKIDLLEEMPKEEE